MHACAESNVALQRGGVGVRSRFGREQSIFAEVVSRTIDGGAQIYTLKDGLINGGNRRMYVSMAGYSAASEIDELKRRRKMGMRGRAERRLKVSARTLFGFREIRDDQGEAIRQEPEPDLSYIFDRVADEFLAGCPWNSLGKRLYEGYNIVSPRTGKPFHSGFFRSAVNSATFWGHTAMNYRNRQRGQHFEPWIYDETVAPPPDVILHRNTHTPIYRGELAEAIKAEIRRRSDVMRGRARPVDTHRFTGLVVCMECGNHLALAHRKGSNYQAMCCQQRWRRECGQRHGINVKKIQQYVHEVLEIALKANNLRIIFKDNQSNEEAIERLRKQCEQTRTSMERLIAGLQAVAVDHPSFGVYTGKIDQLGTMLKTQQHELSVLEARQVARSHEQAERTLRTIDLGTFWSLSDQEINQCLHKIFYPNKIFVHEGKIVQVSEYMGRRSPRTRNSI